MIYISGKITDSNPDVQRQNLARFFEVEKMLHAHCYNPAKNEDKHPDWTYEQYLAEDLLVILMQRPDMYFMKGWQESRGARLEMELAKRMRLDIEFEENDTTR